MAKKTRVSHHNGMISAKDIVNTFNISYHAVNHYTDFGLLSLAFKKGNVRFYERSLVKNRLNIIMRLAGEGYSLRLIRKKLLGV